MPLFKDERELQTGRVTRCIHSNCCVVIGLRRCRQAKVGQQRVTLQEINSIMYHIKRSHIGVKTRFRLKTLYKMGENWSM
jgi:hypothetical protein